MLKRIDWVAAKADYVQNRSLLLCDIAAKYDTTLGTVTSQAHRDHWTEARIEHAKLVQQAAAKKSIADVVGELSRYNRQDLAVAKLLRTKAVRQLDRVDLGPKDIRFLAGAIESAQRVARLALGAATENVESRVSAADQLTPEERRERLRQLHAQLFPPATVQ
jgi:hypothetical protein